MSHVRRLPPMTTAVMGLCIGVAGTSLLLGWSPLRFCLSTAAMARDGEVWRAVTAPWLHAGLLHLLFNMMSLAAIGPSLEKDTLGSLRFLAVNVHFVLVSSLLYCMLEFLWAWGGIASNGLSLSSPLLWRRMSSCAVGYSGVIFGLLVLRCHLSDRPQFSLFGMGRVHARYYPIVSLLVAQLLVPQASLLGHLAGCIAGYLYVTGVTSWTVPNAFIAWMESSPAFQWCRQLPLYAPSPDASLPLRGFWSSLFEVTPTTPGEASPQLGTGGQRRAPGTPGQVPWSGEKSH